MIHYRIRLPLSKAAPGGFPDEKVWKSIGLGHLLPIRLTGQWPIVEESENCFRFSRWQAEEPVDWYVINSDVEIGFAKSTPGPLFLQRETIIPGIPLPDDYGNEWMMPNANPQSPYCSIPKEVQWSPTGPSLIHDNAYRPVIDMCVEILEAVMSRPTLDFIWSAEQALRILQINYRIAAPELYALSQRKANPLTKEFSAAIVLWFIDHRLAMDIQKKKLPAA
jgi:hypothetical protein